MTHGDNTTTSDINFHMHAINIFSSTFINFHQLFINNICTSTATFPVEQLSLFKSEEYYDGGRHIRGAVVMILMNHLVYRTDLPTQSSNRTKIEAGELLEKRRDNDASQ